MDKLWGEAQFWRWLFSVLRRPPLQIDAEIGDEILFCHLRPPPPFAWTHADDAAEFAVEVGFGVEAHIKDYVGD